MGHVLSSYSKLMDIQGVYSGVYIEVCAGVYIVRGTSMGICMGIFRGIYRGVSRRICWGKVRVY